MSTGESATASPAAMRVVIAGGGIAGLEALLALNHFAGDRVDVTLAAPDVDFTYRPLIVEEPFSNQPAARMDLAAAVEELGATFVRRAVSAVDADARELEMDDGSRIAYDKAILCMGARAVKPFSGAISFQDSGESLELTSLLARSSTGDGSIVFVVPALATWSLPVYELALMTERRARESGVKVAIRVVTPESAPLIAFGTRASNAVSELLTSRGIAVTTGRRAHENGGGGVVLTPGGEVLRAQSIVALPELKGPGTPGLPVDEGGFIPIDEHCRVRGAADLFAAGDGTNFPIKQGGLATQQADAAAEQIAVEAGAQTKANPFEPVLRGQLLTGDESLSMQHALAGGTGEGVVSADYLWWPPHKVAGRFLAPWLHGSTAHADIRPPAHSLEVEVALPHEWHREPMALDPLGPLGQW